MIKNVIVFDFDGTLINTIDEEQGKKIYKEKTGNDYPHKGWWGKRETLDVDIFENELFTDMYEKFLEAKESNNTYVSLLTGRIIPLKNQVEKILNKYDLIFDEVVLNGDPRYQERGKGSKNTTIDVKLRYLNDLENRFPHLKTIILYDDREKHKEFFQKFAKDSNLNVEYNFIKR